MTQAPENFSPNERVEAALVAARRSLTSTSFSEWNQETFFRALEKAARSNELTEDEERALIAAATEEVGADADETSSNPFDQTLCDLAFELRDAFRGETPPTLRELRRRWNESDAGWGGCLGDEEKDRDASARAPKPGDRIAIRVELANGASATARYVVMEKIGEGAQKRAFILSQEETGRLLALKQAVKSGRNVRRNFAQEAKTQGILDHPNIPTLFWADASQDGDPNEPPILIESFVPGEPWSARPFDRESRDENLAILMKIATITAYAHREGGVVHRDLKPANVMLGKYDEIYLCDWGFAFVAAEGASRNVAGSLAFAAPEQVRGEAVDFRADVFALGSILYKILTGVAPHEGAGKYTLTELFRRAETGEIDPISEDAAPEELRKIALKALAVDPKERYADAGELADALTNWRRREQIWNRFVDLSLRFAFLREKFQEAERAKEKEKRDVWTVRLGACVGLLNELTTLRRETDEGEGEAEESEAEAKTKAARDRDLTLKFLNAEIAARSWLIDKTIQMKDFTTATALTNEQIVTTKRRFKITGDGGEYEDDWKKLEKWQIAIDAGVDEIETVRKYQLLTKILGSLIVLALLVIVNSFVTDREPSYYKYYERPLTKQANEAKEANHVMQGFAILAQIKEKEKEFKKLQSETLALIDKNIKSCEKIAEENRKLTEKLDTSELKLLEREADLNVANETIRKLRQKHAEAGAAEKSERIQPENAESPATVEAIPSENVESPGAPTP